MFYTLLPIDFILNSQVSASPINNNTFLMNKKLINCYLFKKIITGQICTHDTECKKERF